MEMHDMTPRREQAFSVDMSGLEQEGGADPAFGTVRWRTLICGDRTPSSKMVLGVAEFGPLGTLLAHRHAHAEFYFGISGEGMVTVEGQPHRITPGVAVYLPPDAEHSVLAGEAGLSFAYGFPSDRFAEVEYRFSPASG